MGDQRILKQFFNVLFAVALMGGIGFWLARKSTEKSAPVLRICAWSNYLPEEVLADFHKQTGIRVELSFISSNEELFAKLRAGATGFDLIQPSDYMSRQMIRLGMLRELDHSRLGNLTNLMPEARNAAWDPGLKYTVPFSWGTTGLVVNAAKVSLAELASSSASSLPPGEGRQAPGWELLFESPDPHHTSLLDDMREVFSAMLIWKGTSPNLDAKHTIADASNSLQILETARGGLQTVREKILMFTSEPRQYLVRSELNIAHAYSMDALQAGAEKPDFHYFIPRQGAVRWADNFAIPASARHLDEAYRFLDFILEAKVASHLALRGRFSTQNQKAWDLLPDSEKNNPALYPDPATLARLHYLEDLGDALPVMNRMWAELKI